MHMPSEWDCSWIPSNGGQVEMAARTHRWRRDIEKLSWCFLQKWRLSYKTLMQEDLKIQRMSSPLHCPTKAQVLWALVQETSLIVMRENSCFWDPIFFGLWWSDGPHRIPCSHNVGQRTKLIFSHRWRQSRRDGSHFMSEQIVGPKDWHLSMEKIKK